MLFKQMIRVSRLPFLVSRHRILRPRLLISNLSVRKLSTTSPSSLSPVPPLGEIQHAVVSVFDLFSIGIGPSSSHTVGPMRAAKIFVGDLLECDILKQVSHIRVDLYGSLAMTGVGHGTPNAIFMGLEGEIPEGVDPSSINLRVEKMYKSCQLNIGGDHQIKFNPAKDLVFHYGISLPRHPNGVRFSAFDSKGDLLATNEFFSIGGGFVVNEAMKLTNVYWKDARVDHVKDVDVTDLHPENVNLGPQIKPEETDVDLKKQTPSTIFASLPFHNAESLMQVCKKENLKISQVVFKNELHWRPAEEVTSRTLNLWKVMNQSIINGIHAKQEFLPGQLHVRRRAPKLYKTLMNQFADYAGLSHQQNLVHSLAPTTSSVGPIKVVKKRLPALDWISLYALAVNEENASGGRVVTAPTNGSAGVLPAVLKYYIDFICPSPAHAEQDIVEFLLTASAIGMLYKRGASLSAAEMGCQGEIGVACSMAAGAFAAVMGGTLQQIENAAEIGMEHNLGLTCDPPMGLVVIPCIERNALAAVKAITAAQLALNSEEKGRVTLDQVIATMRQTGMDMMSKYKETSEGGLAVNVPVC